MFVQNPGQHVPQLLQALDNPNTWLVACYCAAWCDTCGDYRGAFQALSERYPQHLFLWVDVEDHPELLDDLDVENFPTLLIQTGGQTRFFGTMLPYIGHLERMLQAVQEEPDSSAPGPTDLRVLLAALV
ncbi:MAG: thioredoxin family protein [Advenella sp.]